MSCERAALEAMSETLRLEAELAIAIAGICRLVQMIEAQHVELKTLNAVRITAQRDTEHWQEEFSLVQEELRRYTALRVMS